LRGAPDRCVSRLSGGSWRSHISGFNSLIPSGLPPGSVLLLLGFPGSGKTSFCWQLLNETLSRGNPGLVIATEGSPTDIKEQVKNFGWDFDSYEQKGLLRFIDCYSCRLGEPPRSMATKSVYFIKDTADLSTISIFIDQMLKELGEGMLIILDSLSTFMTCSTSASVIPFTQLQISRFRASKSIGLIILEEGLHDPQVVNTLRFLCDGAVEMKLLEMETGELVHQLRVHSLRGAKVITRWTPFSLSTTGIVFSE